MPNNNPYTPHTHEPSSTISAGSKRCTALGHNRDPPQMIQAAPLHDDQCEALPTETQLW